MVVLQGIAPMVQYRLTVQSMKGIYFGYPTSTTFSTNYRDWYECEGEIEQPFVRGRHIKYFWKMCFSLWNTFCTLTDMVFWDGLIEVEASHLSAKIRCFEKSDPKHEYIRRAQLRCKPKDFAGLELGDKHFRDVQVTHIIQINDASPIITRHGTILWILLSLRRVVERGPAGTVASVPRHAIRVWSPNILRKRSHAEQHE